MKNVSLKIFAAVLVLIFSVQSFAVYASLDYDEQWHGNALWLPAENVEIPAVHIDPAKWVACFPGSWDRSMVICSMGSFPKVGLKEFYWDAVNEYGMVLYPSKVAKDKVYRNPNSGVDFGKMDMIKICMEIAKLNAVDLKLVVYLTDDNSKELVAELLEMYPEIKIAIVGGEKQYSNERLIAISKTKIASMLDSAGRGKNPTQAYRYSGELTKKYLRGGKILFKKEFTVFDKKDRHLLAVSAREKWTVFVNGKFVGSGIWYSGKFQDVPVRSHTYEIDDLIKKGKNSIVVCAESTTGSRSFIANIRAGDMIYSCDDTWQAVPIEEALTQENFDKIMSNVKDIWKPAQRMGLCSTGACPSIYWNRINN